MADKALIAGINKYKTVPELKGCVNDTETVKTLLTGSLGFSSGSVKVLTDSKVTKAELRKQWKWLLSGAQSGDRLVFHFSGHGSYTADQNGDEADGVDELLCLVDMDWSNSETYLLDEELGAWAGEVPPGVFLTIVLDCCHSGTGTRFVMAPPSGARGFSGNRSGVLVDLNTSLRRLNKGSAARSVGAVGFDTLAANFEAVIPEDSSKVDERSVLARFASPPPEVLARIQQYGRRSSFAVRLGVASQAFGARSAGMNHVLLAGSRSDQTSADAFINGDWHGAFTYYLNESYKSLGTGARVEKLINAVKKGLKDNSFQQEPQLEPKGVTGEFLKAGGGKSSSKPDEPEVDSPPESDSDCGCGGKTPPVGGPSPDQWERITVAIEQIAASMSGGPAGSFGMARATGNRAIVYCHGICVHPAGYSNPWWQSLAKHLPPELRSQLEANRREVLWSRHVSGTRDVSTSPEAVKVRENLQLVLQERAAICQSAAFSGDDEGNERGGVPPLDRAVLGIPGVDCIDDFVKYLTNDQIRAAVINEFVQVIAPLLRSGMTVEVISHSWGTVVAYEALRWLEAQQFTGKVGNFFTVGSALAISYVRSRLNPSDGQKPHLASRWVNLDAKSDIVGGSVRAVGLAVDREYLELEPVGCSGFGWPVKLYSPACAHSSYFDSKNVAVNRDIFAAHIIK